MFSYLAYGLHIQSDLPLPELLSTSDEGPAQVIIRVGQIGRPLPETEVAGTHMDATPDEAYLVWPGAGAFLVREGREIVVEAAAGVEEDIARLFVLGAGLGVLLHQRGYLVLHASAVALGGAAVAFLGNSGWGKSTTAAALHARGHRIVADDVVAVHLAEGEPLLFPGFPQLKLWPEAAAALGDDPEALPRLRPEMEKRARSVAASFHQAPLPVRRLFVLAGGDEPAVEPLEPRDAFVELVRHSYVNRLLAATGAAALHLRQCGALAARVPVCRLKRPLALSGLPALAQLLEDDLAVTVA